LFERSNGSGSDAYDQDQLRSQFLSAQRRRRPSSPLRKMAIDTMRPEPQVRQSRLFLFRDDAPLVSRNPRGANVTTGAVGAVAFGQFLGAPPPSPPWIRTLSLD